MYKQFGLGELKPTNITLSLADRSVKIPKGIVEDVLVKVDKLYCLVDFVVLDTEPIASGPNHVLIILGRPFLDMANAIINCRNGAMPLTFGNMTFELNIFHLSNKHKLVEDEKKEPMKSAQLVRIQGSQISINYKNWLTKMKQLIGSCHQSPLKSHWSAQNHPVRRKSTRMDQA